MSISDPLGLDYSKLTPLLVEAVNALHKELQSTQIAHRQEIAILNRDNEALHQRLFNLESIVRELTAQEK